MKDKNLAAAVLAAAIRHLNAAAKAAFVFLARSAVPAIKRLALKSFARCGKIRAALAAFAVALPLFTLAVCLCPRFDKPLSFAIYDRSDKLLGAAVSVDGQWRFAASHVSPKIAAALITFEDRRFFLHPGVDVLSLARAVRQNVTSGRVVSGGSTLTMQTVRLSQNNPPRTIRQKIREAALALVLESCCTKKEILDLYASNAPYGGNVVGVEAASWRYFNRPPTNITWAEAATLAVLPNQPSLVHPGADRVRLLEKRNRLLRDLCARRYLGTDELALSLDEPLPEAPYPLPRLAPHYLERMRETGTPYTSIDRKLQIAATAILERWSAQFDLNGIHNAAALIIDTKTGEVLAYAGNTGKDRPGQINADVDIIVSRRSSGSILKPFLFAGMLDAGLLLPDQLVMDIPTRIGSYKPENNVPSYQGVVPAGEALSRSLNIPAIRELRDYGIAPFLDLLKKTGFTTFDRTADEYGLPLILGGGEITLEETVRAYAALMNRASDVQYAERKSDGKKHAETRTSATGTARTRVAKNRFPRSPVSTGAAWLTLEALVNGARPSDESLWQSFASARKIAWKTGTSYGNRDAWAVGVTPSYTVGIWVGNATGEGRPELKSISTAAPVLFDIFSILPRSDWPYCPETELEEITVCADSGYAAGPDCANTKAAYKPINARLTLSCPYCRPVSLTPDGMFQATANDLTGKWAGSLPLVKKQFVLPPAIEYWYTRHSLTYRVLPPWIPGHTGDSEKNGLSIIFPDTGAHIFIPVEIDGKPGRLIMEASHRDSAETLYWDIDGDYLGETRGYHQMPAHPAPGMHVLTVTDTRGTRATRTFEILGDPEKTQRAHSN